MLTVRYPLLGAALLAAAFAGSAWAAEDQAVKKEGPAATQPAPHEGSATVAKEDARAGNGAASAERAAQPPQPVVQAPATRRAVSTAEIDDMNRRYPGG